MLEKGSDPEMVLQIGYVFLKLLIHDVRFLFIYFFKQLIQGSREAVLEHADLIKSLLSLVTSTSR